VIAFLNAETDDDTIHDLLWGLIAVGFPPEFLQPESSGVEVPFEFGVPRLLVQESGFVQLGGHWRRTDDAELNALPDPAVFYALMSGQPNAVEQCVNRAARRLKSNGLLVAGYRNRRQAGKSLAVVSPVGHRPERLLASFLFPLAGRDLEKIADAILYTPESKE
jgi:CRISPR-associated protein Csx17